MENERFALHTILGVLGRRVYKFLLPFFHDVTPQWSSKMHYNYREYYAEAVPKLRGIVGVQNAPNEVNSLESTTFQETDSTVNTKSCERTFAI